MTALATYIRYLYNISFGLAGLAAFLAVTYAGFLYLTSTGNPAKIKEARERIFSALLGLGILLISYVLLIAINPNLTLLAIPALEDVKPISLRPLPLKESKSSYLSSVKEIGVQGKFLADGIEDAANLISESLLTKCFCFNAKGLCLCTGGEEGDTCEPKTCYAGDTDGSVKVKIGLDGVSVEGTGHPCSNYEEIKKNQELIMLWLDELIYYQNRAVGEEFLKNLSLSTGSIDYIGLIDDFSLETALADMAHLQGEARRLQYDLDKVLDPTIKYYNDFIATQTDQTTINLLSKERTKKTEEKELTEDLRNELIEFDFLVEILKYAVEEIAKLPDQCALEVQENCEPRCFNYSITVFRHTITACHNTYSGCQALCVGLHPCPKTLASAGIAYGAIDLLQGQITDVTGDIINKIDRIRELRTQF